MFLNNISNLLQILFHLYITLPTDETLRSVRSASHRNTWPGAIIFIGGLFSSIYVVFEPRMYGFLIIAYQKYKMCHAYLEMDVCQEY